MAHFAPIVRRVFDEAQMNTECLCKLSQEDMAELLMTLGVTDPVDTTNTSAVAGVIVKHNKQRIAALQVDPYLLDKIRNAQSIPTISDTYFKGLDEDERLRVCSDLGVEVLLDGKKSMATRIRNHLHPHLAPKDWETNLATIVTKIRSTCSQPSIRKQLNNLTKQQRADVCKALGVHHDITASNLHVSKTITQHMKSLKQQPVAMNNNHTIVPAVMLPSAIPVSMAPEHVKARLYDLQREIALKKQQMIVLEKQLAQYYGQQHLSMKPH